MKVLTLLLLFISITPAQILQIDSGSSVGKGYYKPDQDYINGYTLSSDTYGIGVWKDVRYGIDFSYKIPVENGKYFVLIYLKETNPLQKIGGRIFSITANFQTISSIDLFEKHGLTRSFKVFYVTVLDNYININFHATKGNAIVSAIDIEYDFPGLINYCNSNIITSYGDSLIDWYCRAIQIQNDPTLQ